MQRINTISRHVTTKLSPVPTFALAAPEKGDDDVVICCAVRTAIAKGKRGGFKDTPTEDMLAPVFKEVVKRTGVDAKAIGDVQIGNVGLPGAGALTGRMAQLLGGVPYDVPFSVVNRQCSSGLQATANIAANIKAGIIDVGIAAGVESMTQTGMQAPDMTSLNQDVVQAAMTRLGGGKLDDNVDAGVAAASACMTPMGITSENVAEKWNISRERQDQLAVESHAKAAAAQKAGLFDEEIVPVKTTVKAKDGSTSTVTVDKDEGPRAETTLEGLSKLKASFKQGGTTHAGNASQVSDGAAMVLLARRSEAKKLGLPIVGRFRSYAVVGVDPLVMGIGPAYAIPAALEKANLKIDDVDIFEINEAFASQAVMTVDHLKVPKEKLNPKGGAIALGHPLGCTGARQIATLLPELKRTGKKTGICSMCIGTGMGAAAVIERE
jgi:acetyl-CoA acyltransferase 1